MKLAIEPGSWKWHESKVENDRLKRTLCSKHGVRLITIYSDYNGSVPPFDKDCLCVKETLGFENDLQVLQNLIKDLLRLINIDYEISSSQWESIIRTAYDNSRRITTEEFKNKVLNLIMISLISLFIIFMVIGRLISGVHWVTDVIGGIVLSSGLVMMYYSFVSFFKK